MNPKKSVLPQLILSAIGSKCYLSAHGLCFTQGKDFFCLNNGWLT